MADDELQTAIDAIAREAIANETYLRLDSGDIDWGDYPDIGEHDWDAVTQRIRAHADRIKPDADTYAAAYDFLTGRADG